MITNLVKYYSERANKYERIYSSSKWHMDIQLAGQILKLPFTKKYVLEIAEGRGFWKAFIVQSASSILATDINLPVLEYSGQRE